MRTTVKRMMLREFLVTVRSRTVFDSVFVLLLCWN